MEPVPNMVLPKCWELKWFMKISAAPVGHAIGFIGAAPAGTAPRTAAAVRAANGTTTRLIRLTDQPPCDIPIMVRVWATLRERETDLVQGKFMHFEAWSPGVACYRPVKRYLT